MPDHPLPVDLLLFDVDNTLRECIVPGQPCPNADDEWRLKSGVAEALAHYADTPMALVSNQGGVAYKFLTADRAWALLWSCLRTVRGGRLLRTDDVYFCPHRPDDGCPCRKPSPYMLLRAIRDQWELRGNCMPRAQCLMVGDMASDQEAAARAEVPFVWAKTFFNQE